MTSVSNKKPLAYLLLPTLVLVGFFCLCTTALGQTVAYQPLVGIPGVGDAVTNFGAYINQLYYLAISLAALLAVIKIIFAGVQYMLTDLGTSKETAKTDIKGALLGLLLILSAFLILTTINPSLANLNALSGAPALRLQNPPVVTPPYTVAPGVGRAVLPPLPPGIDGVRPRSQVILFPTSGTTALEPSVYQSRCNSALPAEYEICTSIPNGSCQRNPPTRTSTTPPPAVSGTGPQEVVIQVTCTER